MGETAQIRRTSPPPSPHRGSKARGDANTKKTPERGLNVDLISIESGSEDENTLHLDKFQLEQQFQAELNRLKKQSSQKFRARWNDIISRYGAVDDATQSDEIDLSSGRIVVDNGHLSSLKLYSHKSDVWSLEYDAERDSNTQRERERRRLLKKSILRTKLKAEQQFLNNAARTASRSMSPEKKISPVRKVSPDNILLLNPSPTKKFKGSRMALSDSELDLAEPQANRNDYDNDLDLSSESENEQVLRDEVIGDVVIKRTNYTLRKEPLEIDISVSSDSEERKGDEEDNVDLSEESASEEALHYKVQDTIAHQLIKTSDSDESNTGDSHKPDAGSQYVADSPKLDNPDTDSFDDEYSIVNSPFQLTADMPTIFSCCFESCHYCTGNRYLFRQHLVALHSKELYVMGYPIPKDDIDKRKRVYVTQEMTNKLEAIFPLAQDIPPLPLSSDGSMFCCEAVIGKKRCKREFFSLAELEDHKKLIPRHCSSKRQVYICPILGCGFMTDEGYIAWRSHFVQKGHNIYNRLISFTTQIPPPPPRPKFEKFNKTLDSGSNKRPTKLESTPEFAYTQSTDAKIEQELDLLFNSDDNLGL